MRNARKLVDFYVFFLQNLARGQFDFSRKPPSNKKGVGRVQLACPSLPHSLKALAVAKRR